MKNLFLFILLCFSLNSFGQVRETGTLFYSTNNKLGFELNAFTKSKLTYGFGLTFDLERKNVGGAINKDAYDLYPTGIKSIQLFDLGSLYGTFGYDNDICTLGVKLGVGAKGWYNYLDNGNYFMTNGGTYLLYGVYANPHLNKTLSPYLGYDNFNGFNFGITIRLN